MKQLKNQSKVKYIFKADKTAKFLSVLLALTMILSATPVLVGATELVKESGASSVQTIVEQFEFSKPVTVQQENGQVLLEVDDLSQRLSPGNPQLPVAGGNILLPYKSKNIKVSFDYSTPKTMQVEGTVAAGPIPYLLDLPQPTSPIAELISRIGKKTTEQNTEPQYKDFNDVYSSGEGYGEFIGQHYIWSGRNPRESTDSMATYVNYYIHPCVFTDVSSGELSYIEEASITVTYEPPQETQTRDDEYDLLIMAPSKYMNALDPLVDHKEDVGLSTILVCLDEIYDEDYFEIPEEYTRDEQEQIKYFVYEAMKNWGVDYVLAVGGWRTVFGLDKPEQQFPLRTSHCYDTEYHHAEQYFSCLEKYDEGLDEYVFDTWDTNLNDRFAEWDFQGFDTYDVIPDVYWGRLAARTVNEVKTVVEKIITYETETFGEEWFNKMISVTGDGFQDIGYDTPNDIAWDISGLDDGEYTIYSQSYLQNDEDWKGLVDSVTIEIDRSSESSVTFLEDDHLEDKIIPVDEEQEDYYPGKPVAEIVVPQTGDVLGNTDVGPYVPPEAYIGDYWAVVEYNATNEIVDIRVKSYEPAPHALNNNGDSKWRAGSRCKFDVWVEDSSDNEVFRFDGKTSSAYWEGEIEAEQAIIYANGGDYKGAMIEPEDEQFVSDRLWTSNGLFYGMWDVLNGFSEGYGLAYVNGHSSCMVYADHYPGAPGGRDDGSVNGWAVINLQAGYQRYHADQGDPLLPLRHLQNEEMLPVLLYSGCHSGQFDTSFVSVFYDPYSVLLGERYGTWTPEAVMWSIVRLNHGGAIAAIGNGGLGSGYIGSNIQEGYTGWLFPQFFFNYNGNEDDAGQTGPHLDVMGETYTQTLIDYATRPNEGNPMDDKGIRKHFEQWDLLGDPSLKIGGYDMKNIGRSNDNKDDSIQRYVSAEETAIQPVESQYKPLFRGTEFQVTTNPAVDSNPSCIVSDGAGTVVVGYEYETPGAGDIHPGFAMSSGGALWNEMLYANSFDSGAISIYRWEEDGNEKAVASVSFGGGPWGCFRIGNLIDPNTWAEDTPWGFVNPLYPGSEGLAVTGHGSECGGVWTYSGGVFADWVGPGIVHDIASGSASAFDNFAGDCDHSTLWHFWVFEQTSMNTVYVVRAEQTDPVQDNFQQSTISGALNPDVAAEDGYAYIVYESSGSIMVQVSDDNGETWDTYEVTDDGANPQVLITEDGDVECYYVKDDNVYKSVSTNHGSTWSDDGQVGDAEVDGSASYPFQVVPEALVYDKGDGDLYAEMLVDTKGITIGEIGIDDSRKKVVTDITNSGTLELDDIEWTIELEGISPVGEWAGLGPILSWIVQGHILMGRTSNGGSSLATLESEEITSGNMFGFGTIQVKVTASADGEILAQKTEDGSLLAGTIVLSYPEE